MVTGRGMRRSCGSCRGGGKGDDLEKSICRGCLEKVASNVGIQVQMWLSGSSEEAEGSDW